MGSPLGPKLDDIVSVWPVAASLVESISVGDLLNLARSSTALRATLHDIGKPEPLERKSIPFYVRPSLRIGDHQTFTWKQLKNKAPFTCASPGHTKGSEPRPCKYCSKPICEACVVRSSMAKPNEGTYRNRCRSLCRPCWERGNPTKRRRYPATQLDYVRTWEGWYGTGTTSIDVCTCTLLKDGWICLDCKGMQNNEAKEIGSTTCFGEDCKTALGSEKDRRKICLWCNKPLPALRSGTESRHPWNKKVLAKELADSRRADFEEYNRTRMRQLRMSRRELRGDDAVKDDPDADKQQFVRHLDTVNYLRFMDHSSAPDGASIYASKAGKFKYPVVFLLRFGRLPEDTFEKRDRLKASTSSSKHEFARTNIEKIGSRRDRVWSSQLSLWPPWPVEPWHDLKAHILQAYVKEEEPLVEVQRIMQQNHHFLGTEAEYVTRLKRWQVYRTTDDDATPSDDSDMCSDAEDYQSVMEISRRAQEKYNREIADELQAQLYAEEVQAQLFAEELQAQLYEEDMFHESESAEDASGSLPVTAAENEQPRFLDNNGPSQFPVKNDQDLPVSAQTTSEPLAPVEQSGAPAEESGSESQAVGDRPPTYSESLGL